EDVAGADFRIAGVKGVRIRVGNLNLIEVRGELLVDQGMVEDGVHSILNFRILVEAETLGFLNAELALDQVIEHALARGCFHLIVKLEVVLIAMIEVFQGDHRAIDPSELRGGLNDADAAKKSQEEDAKESGRLQFSAHIFLG